MPPGVQTERLLLRPPEPGDLAALTSVLTDPEVMRYIGSGRPLTPAEVAGSLDQMIARFELDGFGLFAAERLDTGEVIGRVGLLVWEAGSVWRPTTLAEASGPTEIEIGWTLARATWGYGYATEAASAVRDWALAALGRTRLVSLIQPGNERSIRVAEKLGERLESVVVTSSGQRALLYSLER